MLVMMLLLFNIYKMGVSLGECYRQTTVRWAALNNK